MSDALRVPTNLRTLLILEAVSQSNEPLSPTEINRAIGLPKQSIHRLCQTMVAEGFLIRDVSGNRLSPAPRTSRLAQGLLASRQTATARRQVLLTLAETIKETINFVVPEPDGMTYLDRIETDWLFRIELPIGSRVPFYCTASGKCYLASLSGKDRERTLKTIRFEPRTINTHMSTASLAAELEQIEKQGYAIDNEELFDGMIALAVPVTDASGRFIAALAFHGPTQRLDRDGLLQHLDLLRDGARQLAEL
ncbi:IclR family transcriptional regulator [Pseudahrensia aquimaris]|uniref:IclR family transcriptional regulator n=1 Tax=Pseudahrensia aquimaris TaxID=744461 RepID=A0ABW3FFU7_9HYPH